jgi:hypothetical protein
MCSFKVNRFFNLPHTALRCCVKDRQKSTSQAIKTKLGRKQVFPCKAELSSALSFDRKKSFWLDSGRVMHLAYLIAVRNGIKSLFFNRNEETERKWLKNFLHHSFIHSTICLTIGPTRFPKRFHHIVRSRVSSFK